MTHSQDIRLTLLYLDMSPEDLLPLPSRRSPASRLYRTTIAEVAEALAACRITTFDDVREVMARGTTMDDVALRKGRWLMRMDRFWSRLLLNRDDFLLVDGYCFDTVSGAGFY